MAILKFIRHDSTEVAVPVNKVDAIFSRSGHGMILAGGREFQSKETYETLLARFEKLTKPVRL